MREHVKELALFVLFQVVWSEKQMFVLFCKLIFHTDTTPSLSHFVFVYAKHTGFYRTMSRKKTSTCMDG